MAPRSGPPDYIGPGMEIPEFDEVFADTRPKLLRKRGRRKVEVREILAHIMSVKELPVRLAWVELWQAVAAGKVDMLASPSPAEEDLMARGKEPPPLSKPLVDLIEEVEELCRIYVGKGAESEAWQETCERFVKLDRLVRRVRRDHPAETTTAAARAAAASGKSPWAIS